MYEVLTIEILKCTKKKALEFINELRSEFDWAHEAFTIKGTSANPIKMPSECIGNLKSFSIKHSNVVIQLTSETWRHYYQCGGISFQSITYEVALNADDDVKSKRIKELEETNGALIEALSRKTTEAKQLRNQIKTLPKARDYDKLVRTVNELEHIISRITQKSAHIKNQIETFYQM